MEFWSVFQEVWAIRALIASSLVGVMCGALGAFIVLRNMSMIGDALSHAILPGVVVAFVIFQGYTSLGFFAGAVVAGLLTAFAITWIQQNIKTKNDAAIGIVFTAMFSIGVIGISWISRNQGVHLDLKDFLFGNVLTVSDEDLYLTATVAVFVIMSIIVFYRYLFISTFQPVIAETMGISANVVHYFLMLLLSFAVVASLQTVGVILVVAMLITPASTALLLSDRLQIVVALSAIIGLLAAVSGLALAILFETTPGPAMAVTATAIYFITGLFAPKKGLIARNLASRNQKVKIEREDLLKLALKLNNRGKLNLPSLIAASPLTNARTKRHINHLTSEKMFDVLNNNLTLAAPGQKRANALVRAHRLWETYLVDQVGLSSEQIHDEAEKYEHVLSEDLLDEVDKELGYPLTDPHGSPIPGKSPYAQHSLSKLGLDQEATISKVQLNANAAKKLWELGIQPGEKFRVVGRSGSSYTLQINNEKFDVTRQLADDINITLDHSSSSSPI